jgi:hypothetical protein
VAQAVKTLPSKHEALCSNPNATKKKKKKERKENRKSHHIDFLNRVLVKLKNR